MNRICWVILFVSVASIVNGQTLSSIKLDEFYSNSFDKVLAEISIKYNVKFEFDRAKLKPHLLSDRPFSQPLDEFLTRWCRKFKLKWYQDNMKVIHIIGRDEIVESLAAVQEKKKADQYKGGATKFNFTLSGKIKDGTTGESLPGATLLIKGTTHGATTNTDGFYSLHKVPTDTSTLLISYIGYETSEIKLNPVSAALDFPVELIPASQELETVVVLAEREGVLQTNQQISAIKMTPMSLSKLPNLGERDIMRSFQLMPGVSAANESSSGLFVRGGTPDQNLILYDGFTIYHVDHLYGFYSAFNANAIKDVQLYKGGFESRFGGRLSSVMEVTGKDGNAKEFNMSGDLSLLSMNFFIEAPIGNKITTMFAYRRSYQGPLYNKIFDLYNTSTTAQSQPGPGGGGPGGGGPGRFGATSSTSIKSYFYDLNSKISYRPSNKDIISLSLFNGTDKLDNSQKIETPSFLQSQGINFGFSISDLTKYGNIGTSLKWSRQWTKNVYTNTTVSYSNYYSDRDRTNEANISRNGEETTFKNGTLENNDLKDYSFKSDVIYDASEKHQFMAGVFGTHYDIAYTYSQNDTATILDRYNLGNLQGVYLQDRIKLFNTRLMIVPGLRSSQFDVTTKWYHEPRLSLTYQLTEKLKVIGASGKYYQFANRVIREDILSGSRDFWILSDGENVPVSSANHYIAGLSYENNDYLFSVEAYRKDYTGLSEYSLRFTPSMRTTNYNEYFYNGIGYSKGIEFLAQRKYGKFNGWASYTLARSENQFDIYGSDYFPAAQDVRNEFKAIGIFELGRWNLSATWIYATGRPYTSPEGGYEITLLDGTTRDYISIGKKNGERLPDYHRMDIAANYKLVNKDGNNIGQIGLSIFNLYNRKNVWYKEFNIADGGVVESNIEYLGITPNISLSLRLR